MAINSVKLTICYILETLSANVSFFWINDEMFCYSEFSEVEEATLFENMALIKFESQEYQAVNVARCMKAASFRFSVVRKDDLQQNIDLPIKAVSCYQSEADGSDLGESINLGKKVDCPKENVYAFWNGEVFTMLVCNDGACIFVQKECKSFQALEIGFVLEQEDGTKDLFPYCEVPLEFNS